MQFFQELGSLVEQRWRDESYSEEGFPDIAEQALAETAPNRNVDPWEIIRWLITTTNLPQQQDVPGAFGNPPITLFCGPRFYIDVYYWLDGTTSIHQHSFSGAFQVLLGSSLHSKYSFAEEQRINAHFSAGTITLNSVELLVEGDIRRILPGKEYIHSLFHLDRPSVSIVIRTPQTPSALPQYDYRKPYFAMNPFYESHSTIKKVQSASLLLSMKHPDADDIIGELLLSSDLQTAFSILDLAFNHFGNDQMEKAFGLSAGRERFESYLETARRRHGKLVDLIVPVLEEVQRQHNLIRRRNRITASEHRYFLALLLNVPDRGKILDLVKQRFPERDPIDTVIEWVEELANTKEIGSSEPNVLGIDGFDEEYMFVLQSLFEGLTLEQIKNRFEEEYSPEEADGSLSKLEELFDTIRNSMPFKSVFSASSHLATAASFSPIQYRSPD